MFHFLSKKNPLSVGADNGFFSVCWMNLGHYQPFVLAADNNDSGEYENKVNKVDDGCYSIHGSNINKLNFKKS
jgi:hypothetical protein